MTLRLGFYRNDALKRLFRMAGAGGYVNTRGVMRKRIDAMMMGFYRKPTPA